MSNQIGITTAINNIATNAFAVASKKKLRFQMKGRGNLSVEDLWSLSKEELNSIYQALDAEQQKLGQGRSLMEDDKPDQTLVTKKLVVEAIFRYNDAIQKMAIEHRDNQEYMQRVAAVLDRKRDQALENMTPEQLEAILKNGGPIPDAANPADAEPPAANPVE